MSDQSSVVAASADMFVALKKASSMYLTISWVHDISCGPVQSQKVDWPERSCRAQART